MISLPELINLLNSQYLDKYKTKIIGGFEEPFYQPQKEGKFAEIQFSHDYIRSALHEIAHWCVAGIERRKLDDYGYWYTEDGRSQNQQDEFFKLEIVPQTFEWAFSIVCGVKFEASVDNLNNTIAGIDNFNQNLYKKMQFYLETGFPKRVHGILTLLANEKKIEYLIRSDIRKQAVLNL